MATKKNEPWVWGGREDEIERKRGGSTTKKIAFKAFRWEERGNGWAEGGRVDLSKPKSGCAKTIRNKNSCQEPIWRETAEKKGVFEKPGTEKSRG